MKITVVYGTQRKGSTYHIAQQFLKMLEPGPENIREFFLPKDAPNFCRGCMQCFIDSEKCPDYTHTGPILKAMEASDLLIFTSPVYVYHTTGQMKTFLDHFAFQWMPHRPNGSMFHKQALIVSAAAGGGTMSSMKDIADSLSFWGVARTYQYGVNTAAADWDGISPAKKAKIEKDVRRLSAKILRQGKHVKPSLKVKALFYVMRFMQKRWEHNPPDVAYWKAQGWLGKARPW